MITPHVFCQYMCVYIYIYICITFGCTHKNITSSFIDNAYITSTFRKCLRCPSRAQTQSRARNPWIHGSNTLIFLGEKKNLGCFLGGDPNMQSLLCFFSPTWSLRWFLRGFSRFAQFALHFGDRPCKRDSRTDQTGYCLKYPKKRKNARTSSLPAEVVYRCIIFRDLCGDVKTCEWQESVSLVATFGPAWPSLAPPASDIRCGGGTPGLHRWILDLKDPSNHYSFDRSFQKWSFPLHRSNFHFLIFDSMILVYVVDNLYYPQF